MQTLGGLKQYINPYRNHREQLALARRAAIAKRAKDDLAAEQLAYDRFRREEAERLLERLGDSDRTIIEADARAKVTSYGNTSLAQTMLGFTRTRIILERQGKGIPPIRRLEGHQKKDRISSAEAFERRSEKGVAFDRNECGF